jgi:hypothetical protein
MAPCPGKSQFQNGRPSYRSNSDGKWQPQNLLKTIALVPEGSGALLAVASKESLLDLPLSPGLVSFKTRKIKFDPSKGALCYATSHHLLS